MSVGVVGIFVGGASRRMGGYPKGLLPATEKDGSTIVLRTLRLADAIASEVVLLGAHDAYRHLPCRTLVDEREGAGPLGGLVTLLSYAKDSFAIGLACDMPYLTAPLLRRLATATDAAPIVAPRDGGRWSALFARYDAARVLPMARAHLVSENHSLQTLFEEARAHELPLSSEERLALKDWDHPGDMAPCA